MVVLAGPQDRAVDGDRAEVQIKRRAVDLGVHPEALRTWIRQAEADAGERGGRLTTGEREELAALRRENVQLKRANEVLRTASAFSPRSSTRPGPGDGAP
ncbi:transposase [Streptomyces sp. NPDC088817]|uniref:transposase n=1 Tax=Streptomyces sp. NPDC088817 TaxID=3365907 RepID=UPI00381BD024